LVGGGGITNGNEYRAAADEFLMSGKRASDPRKKVLTDLGTLYLRFANWADEAANDLALKLAFLTPAD
jgi:hypothetical protein